MYSAKVWYTSKMLWFNILAGAVAIASAFGYVGEVPAEWAPFIPAIVALINVILRAVTKQPLSLRK